MSQIETPVGPSIGVIQTDTFCQECGYNLHTQAVLRDERLNLLVCRCPECGRYAPAGHATSAARVWLNRLALGLLIVWILFLLFCFGLLGLFEGIMPYAHVMESTRLEQNNLPHRMAPSPYSRQEYRYVPRSAKTDDADSLAQLQQELAIFVLIATALGVMTGGMFSVVFWHCRSWKRLFALTPPLVGCAWTAFLWANNERSEWCRGWGLIRIGGYFVAESAGVALGLWIGRPFARAALQIFIPPKPRQMFAFLWTTDGKRLPV